MASALQWFLFAMFVWACCVLMSALESRVSANADERKANTRGNRKASWWRRLMEEDDEEVQAPETSPREQAMASEIVELKDRIATLEAIVTDRRYQWEEELNK